MLLEWNDGCLTDYDRLYKSVNREILTPAWHRKPAIFQTKFKFELRLDFYYSSDEQIIEMISEFKFAIINLLIHPWEERLTCFDCKQVSPAISLFVFLLTKNNTTSSPSFLC